MYMLTKVTIADAAAKTENSFFTDKAAAIQALRKDYMLVAHTECPHDFPLDESLLFRNDDATYIWSITSNAEITTCVAILHCREANDDEGILENVSIFGSVEDAVKYLDSIINSDFIFGRVLKHTPTYAKILTTEGVVEYSIKERFVGADIACGTNLIRNLIVMYNSEPKVFDMILVCAKIIRRHYMDFEPDDTEMVSLIAERIVAAYYSMRTQVPQAQYTIDELCEAYCMNPATLKNADTKDFETVLMLRVDKMRNPDNPVIDQHCSYFELQLAQASTHTHEH